MNKYIYEERERDQQFNLTNNNQYIVLTYVDNEKQVITEIFTPNSANANLHCDT